MRPGERQRKCPSCGRLVILNDDENKVWHEAPECDAFKRAIENVGGERIDGVRVELVRNGVARGRG